MDNDEVDLGQYLGVFWRRRYVIIAVALGAVFVAGLISFVLPPVYEAKAAVLVTKAPFQIGAPPDPTHPGLKIEQVLVSDLPTETLVAFAKLPAIVQQVADAPEVAIPSGKLSRKIFAQTIRNTNLVELRVRDSNPAWAFKVANIWAAVVVAKSEGLFSTEAQQSYAFFNGQLNGAKERLATADEAMRNFNASSRIGVLQARLNAITAQIAAYESRLTDTSVALQKSETELSQIESQIQRQPKTLTLSKSITADPFVLEAASQAEKKDLIELSKLNLKNEELNPVYINLDQARANTSVQVATLGTEREKLLQAIGRLNNDLASLRVELATQQFLQTRLTRNVEDAKQVYDVLLQRRDEARVASASQTGSAKVVVAAIPPDTPVAPHKSLNMTLGGLLGLMAGSILAFAMEFSSLSTSARILPSLTQQGGADVGLIQSPPKF